MSFSRLPHSIKSFKVCCICGGFGFPIGTASTKRILLMGKGLVSTGVPFHVWHVGPSSFAENTEPKGEFDGVTYEYLSPSVRRPSNPAIRAAYYLWGCLVLAYRLIKNRKNTVAYVYYQGDMIDFWCLWLCRLLRIPSVQEACEWWPGTEGGTTMNAWMYNNIMFRWSCGALPISHEIAARIRKIAGDDYPLCMVPVLVDPGEKKTHAERDSVCDSSRPVLLWCGMVDGYKRDVLFLIEAVSQLKSSLGENSILRIVGPCSEKCKAELLSYASCKNIPAQRLDITGFVSDDELWKYCSQADALLMPLWDDDRSITRFPTKLGQYLAAGKPIVTTQIGEVSYFLTDESAIFYSPGDSTSLALSVDGLLTNRTLSQQRVDIATREALPKVDFRSNAERIGKWLSVIYSVGTQND